MRGWVATVLLAASVGAAGCSGGGKERGAAAPAPVAVEVQEVTPSVRVEGVEVTGTLEAKSSCEVKTQIPGIVREVYVTEWVPVRRGDRLLRIDTAEVEALVKRAEAAVEVAKGSRAQQEALESRARREEARVERLVAEGLATRQALDEARSEREAAQARVTAAAAQVAAAQEELRQARVRLSKGLVTAPMDGVIAERRVNVGDLASDAAAAGPVFRIVDNRVLDLTVTVPSGDAARIRPGQEVGFTVDSLPGREFSGRVTHVNPELSAADRSMRVIARIDNRGMELKSGMFAKGRIVTARREGVLMVPRSALVTWDPVSGKGALFVVKDGKGVRRGVTTGPGAGELVEIRSGVAAGERLVVRGGFALKEGEPVTVVAPAKGGKG